jgi:small-conductance mechanosensitive channel
LLRRLARRLVDRAKEDHPIGPIGAELSLGGRGPVSTRRRQRLDALGAVTDSIISIVVWTAAFFTILGTTFGVNLGPFIAGAGILGVALGFGAQDLVKDFVSGVFMLAEDQFGVGDVVDVGEATGVVERVSLRTTRLRDVTGTLWHVPNGEIRRVGNMSQEWSRALLDIGVAYDTDIDHAIAVIREVAEGMAADAAFEDQFLDTPEVWGVEDLAADGILIRLVIKTVPGEQWKVARELRHRLKQAFDEAEIEIPFPQRTVWMRTDDAPADDS